MRLSIVTEHRFSRTPDGAVWTSTASAYPFWTRYLSVFDQVNVTARVLEVTHVGDRWVRADGPGVCFSAVPHYLGPYQFVICWLSIRRAMLNAIREDDAVLMRVPSFLANCLEPVLHSRRQPFGLEVLGDPYDGFSRGASQTFLRPLLRVCVPRQLRRQCRRAVAVAYVTKYALQRRYPNRSLMVGVSDVNISSDAIAAPRVAFPAHSGPSLLRPPGFISTTRAGPVRLICVGTLEQLYKGQDVLVRAFSQCVAQGIDLRLTLVGDGRLRPGIEALARELGVSDRCEFLGELTQGAAVRKELDKADLFVLATRSEGLPRAIIEAMARGLPCISTTVGGIPELLPPEDLVPPDNPHAFAAKIREVVDSMARREQMSRRNVSVAHEYVDDVLQTKVTEFYRHIRTVTGENNESSR